MCATHQVSGHGGHWFFSLCLDLSLVTPLLQTATQKQFAGAETLLLTGGRPIETTYQYVTLTGCIDMSMSISICQMPVCYVWLLLWIVTYCYDYIVPLAVLKAHHTSQVGPSSHSTVKADSVGAGTKTTFEFTLGDSSVNPLDIKHSVVGSQKNLTSRKTKAKLWTTQPNQFPSPRCAIWEAITGLHSTFSVSLAIVEMDPNSDDPNCSETE